MKDLQREILSQVAAGTISAEEGAARLEALEAAPPQASTTTTAAPPETAAPAGIRLVKVVATLGSADIVGDPSVDFAVADGPHRARQDGDTMVIEHAPFDDDDTFTFGRGESRRIVINGLDWQRRKFTVRMNPSLPLLVNLQAGNARVEGVHGPITSELQAGNCTVEDFRGPLNLSVQAGNVNATGRLDSGSSKVRCEMGSVKIALERGSSVRIRARSTMGKVSIEGEGHSMGTAGKDVTIGGGSGSLDIDCTMGNVKVAVK